VECVTALVKFHKTVLEILSGLLEFSPADKQTDEKAERHCEVNVPIFFKVLFANTQNILKIKSIDFETLYIYIYIYFKSNASFLHHNILVKNY